MDMLDFIRDHFAHAAPILFVGAMGVAIILERFFALFLYYPMSRVENFFTKVGTLVMSAKFTEATQFCDSYKRKPVANVMKSALERAHLPEGIIRDGIQLAQQKCARAILKRTSYLATIANVATLLGLFGTVAGLIHSFQAVTHADPQQKSAMLSAGIATAMNATMMGLAVAIPCMMAYSFLMNRTNSLLADLEQAAVRSMDILKQRFYQGEGFRPTGGNGSTSTPENEIRRAS